MELRSGEKEVTHSKSTTQQPAQQLMEVTVAAVVFAFDGNRLRVLGQKTASEHFTLPKYSFESGMSLSDAANLAVKRVAPVQVQEFFQVGAFSAPPDVMDAAPGGASTVEVCFFGVARTGTEEMQAETQTEPTRWFDLEETKQLDGVSSNRVDSALSELRRRARFESIAFNFLNEEFSLSELQKVFEAILGKSIDVRNFRKKIEALEILTESPNKPRGMAYRPPRLFLFNKPRYEERVNTDGEVRFY